MSGNEFEKLTDLELDDLLREWKVPEAPARMGLRSPRRYRVAAWAGIAAAPLLVVILLMTQRSATAPGRDERPFVPIPYTAPFSKYESAAVVRVNVTVAALLAAGYEIPAADPSALVTADILVGEDGRPHAIRLPEPVR
jgi:hypothetical protein